MDAVIIFLGALASTTFVRGYIGNRDFNPARVGAYYIFGQAWFLFVVILTKYSFTLLLTVLQDIFITTLVLFFCLSWLAPLLWMLRESVRDLFR